MLKIASIVTWRSRPYLQARPVSPTCRDKAPRRPSPPIFIWTGSCGRLDCQRPVIGAHRSCTNVTIRSTNARREAVADRQSQQSGTARMGSRRSDRFQLAGVALDCLRIEGDCQWTPQKGKRAATHRLPTSQIFGAGPNGFGYDLATQQRLAEIAIVGGDTVAASLVCDSLWSETGDLVMRDIAPG